MLTNDEYDTLKVGDVLLWDGRPRTVRDINPRYIQFSILHRSWTGRAYTVYNRYETRVHGSLPSKGVLLKAACERELGALLASGFDPVAEIERELAEDDRMIAAYPEDREKYKASHALARAVLRKLKSGGAAENTTPVLGERDG